MKKFLILMALTGMITVSAQNTCYGESLLRNGDFGAFNQDGMPQGWHFTIARNTNIDFSPDTSEKITGRQSFRIVLLDSGGQATLSPEPGAVRAPIPGKTYELRLWIMAENLDFNRFRITPIVRLNFHPSRARPHPMINLLDELGNASPWQELRLLAKAPDDAEQFLLDIVLTNGTVWIDNVSLRQID